MGELDHSDQGSLDLLMSKEDEESRGELYPTRRSPFDPRHIVVPRPVILAELLLIILVSATATLVIAKLALKPTDRQCAKQLSVYCETSTLHFDCRN